MILYLIGSDIYVYFVAVTPTYPAPLSFPQDIPHLIHKISTGGKVGGKNVEKLSTGYPQVIHRLSTMKGTRVDGYDSEKTLHENYQTFTSVSK